MSYKLRHIVGLILAFCFMITVGGCAKRFNVSVELDNQSWVRAYGQTLPSLEVDLVGINKSEHATWENYPVGKYFSPNDALRRDADRVTLTFTSNDREGKVLSNKDPIWFQWVGKKLSKNKGKGAKSLFLLANIPGIEDLPGDQDPRRLILPLQRSAWPIRTNEIEIVIKSSMAVCTTSQKSKEKK